MPVPMLDAFDYSNTTSPLNERPVTTVAPQSLLMLNDAFMQQQATVLAGRITKEVGDTPDDFIARGFQLSVGRDPTKQERELSRDFIRRQQISFTGLRTRLTFRPDVPTSLAVSYLEKLKGEDYLVGPHTGWDYHRGRWSAAYEGIRTMEHNRGPFALAMGTTFSNGIVEAKIVLHNACESAGLLFRASANANEARGYEVALEPREQRIVLRRHAEDFSTLAQSSAPVHLSESLPLKVQFHDASIRVWVGGSSKAILEFVDPKPILSSGRVGIRAWGAAVSIDDLTLRPDHGPVIAIRDEQLPPPGRRALEAFCLLLLNLNEVVYVD